MKAKKETNITQTFEINNHLYGLAFVGAEQIYIYIQYMYLFGALGHLSPSPATTAAAPLDSGPPWDSSLPNEE